MISVENLMKNIVNEKQKQKKKCEMKKFHSAKNIMN